MIEIDINLKAALDDAIARAVAIGGLVAIALIHVLEAPDAFSAIGYLGALFVAAIVGCLVIAAALSRTSDDRVWIAAAALPALILLGYIISRAIGLPGFTEDVGVWTEPLGLASMVAEGLLILVGGAVLVTRHSPMPRTAASRTTRDGLQRLPLSPEGP